MCGTKFFHPPIRCNFIAHWLQPMNLYMYSISYPQDMYMVYDRFLDEKQAECFVLWNQGNSNDNDNGKKFWILEMFIYTCVWKFFSLHLCCFKFLGIVSSTCMTRQIMNDKNYSNHVSNKSWLELIFFFAFFIFVAHFILSILTLKEERNFLPQLSSIVHSMK